MNRLLFLILTLMAVNIPTMQAQLIATNKPVSKSNQMNPNSVQLKTTPVKASERTYMSSNVPMRTVEYFWDFEEPSDFEGWTYIDNDGDGYGWEIDENYGYYGPTCMASASCTNTSSLDPDNWLISPRVPLGGWLALLALNYSDFYADQFAVYACVGEYDSVDDFVQVSDLIAPGTAWTEYCFNLSQFGGQMGYFAIRHFESYDQIRLFIDDISLTIFKTDTPVITWEDTGEGVVVTATGNGHICLYCEDIVVAEGEGYATYTMPYGEEEVEYVFSATAQEDDKEVSESVECEVIVPAMAEPIYITPDPYWISELTEDAMVITALGEGAVMLYIQVIDNVTGEMTTDIYEGDGEVVAMLPRTEETYYINIWAVAIAYVDNAIPGTTAVEYYVEIPAKEVAIYETPAPQVTCELTDDAMEITAVGEGIVTLYIQIIDNATGEMTTETYEGDGEVVAMLPRTEETYYINFWAVAVAHMDGALPGTTGVEYFVEIPAKEEVPVVPGDVDGDGKVTVSDVTSIIDYILSQDPTGINVEGADFDGDGHVTVSDVTSIIDYILGGGM